MKKFIIDFVFNERTGESKIVIDFNDDSMSSLEMNEAIRDGQIREDVLRAAESMFGKDIADKARQDKIKLVCLDHHPEAADEASGILISQNDAQQEKKTIKQ